MLHGDEVMTYWRLVCNSCNARFMLFVSPFKLQLLRPVHDDLDKKVGEEAAEQFLNFRAAHMSHNVTVEPMEGPVKWMEFQQPKQEKAKGAAA